MYFKNIFCVETEKLSRLENVELTVTIGELNNDYWCIEQLDNGSFIRLKPLFNCTRMESSNPYDIVIEDNKCLICQNKMDTVIICY